MDLRVTLIQSELYWKSPDANRAMFEEKISAIQEETDIIVLPEMFTTGFTMDATEVAEPPGLTTERWMKQLSNRTKAVITGSYVVRDGKNYFNRLLWVDPDRQIWKYDKRHLFRMAGEDQHYDPGTQKLICEWKGWKIALFICYDLRFPVWIRNSHEDSEFDYDLAVFVANWPAPRARAWDILLKARAIENSACVVGLNRTGKDGADVDYEGGSLVVNPKGEEIVVMGDTPGIRTVTLSREELVNYRKKFPVHVDADRFYLK